MIAVGDKVKVTVSDDRFYGMTGIIQAHYDESGSTGAHAVVHLDNRKGIWIFADDELAKVDTDTEKTYERVKFRLFQMPCCGQSLCWVNPRLPNYCPECAAPVLTQLRANGLHTLVTDDDAVLELHHQR